MPSFLAHHKYENVEDPKTCPFQQGAHTEDSAFEWFQQHSAELGYFLKWLPHQRGNTTWLETDLCGGLVAKQDAADTVTFVDVGGSVGNVCVDLRKKLPGLKGRVFNQDLPHVVSNTIPYPGVEQSAHDFWKVQPIKGVCRRMEWERVH